MARKLRHVETDGVYHVTARRVEGSELFISKQDFIRMKTLLKSASAKFNVTYLAYCLMGNHYHLLVMTPDGNLSQFMQWVNSRYSNYYNFAYDRDGHVFQGRYDSQLVDNDSYLLEVSRYLHLNPVRAKMVELPEQYAYSSYRTYTGHPDWLPVATDEVLKHFANAQDYFEFVDAGIKPQDNDNLNQAQMLLSDFSNLNGLAVEELVNPQTKEHRLIRRNAVSMLAEKTALTAKEIGRLTGIDSPATLYRLMKK